LAFRRGDQERTRAVSAGACGWLTSTRTRSDEIARGGDAKALGSKSVKNPISSLQLEPIPGIAGFSVMPKYFFNVYHDRADLDFEGEELPDKHAAWHEATVMAGQTLQRLDGKLQPDKEWRMEVTDEFANPLYVLHIHAETSK